MSSTSIDYIIKYYAKNVGIKDQVSPHSCRATVIGHLLEQGVNLYEVSKLVNHKSVDTTKAYNKRRSNIEKSAALKVSLF
jgi:integrase/recombinase XerD